MDQRHLKLHLGEKCSSLNAMLITRRSATFNSWISYCSLHDACVMHMNLSGGHVPFEKKMARYSDWRCDIEREREMDKLVGSCEIFLRLDGEGRHWRPSLAMLIFRKTAEVACDLRIYLLLHLPHHPFYFIVFSASLSPFHTLPSLSLSPYFYT